VNAATPTTGLADNRFAARLGPPTPSAVAVRSATDADDATTRRSTSSWRHGFRSFSNYRLRILLAIGGCNWALLATPAR
jgi:hypothetical protein